ncbi:MAG: hypothetical protein A2360_04940 [Candidatus Staskawiczbacteria bacterium RIFOXYB1_FULL_32_11]|uniref:Uncharacterized protein n=1 Tax=Candidatus Staskawiczbacteria bacterium RIFOXYD1_FULL_32_13 TaxID=1802234 RepID=A0A1G2JPC9_9BACT|nr:MAG: hypothetical protein UR22_C0001G0005 [Parcubacteria group bacterium GW2011_GWC2_32_10]OGZ77722.1 MAG: hypothetical protein A2256_01505 [Candidatus Staskawiczbacteria bacterium RIFOXYA2_FULL_32_7]OGZ79762.1 MAG: hypothetical protein A2360_04940 [Candidatus Staskawiczbacteria bacterium RIFOXYB1_FULL_32_11]OGZ88140.1 MAG: hypothetical protein A2561_05535 [Candidatus Staskawiczbacteria bacterium RIFOXYD1_FULL_32_13]
MPKFNPDSQLNIHELTVEEPEKQTPGHDAEPFLTEVFSWIRDKSGYGNPSKLYFTEMGDIIDMRLSGLVIPDKFIDETTDGITWKKVTYEGVFSDLKERLKGKKIISIIANNWYLKVVNDKENKKIANDVPQMPENKQF